MPVVLTEGVAAKKTASTIPLAHRKVQPKTKEEEKALASEEEEEESSEETPQSCSDLPTDFRVEKKKPRSKSTSDIPVYEEYLPSQEEQLENKVRWLIDQQLSKHRNNLAKKRGPSSSSELDSTSASEGESFSDDSEKSLPPKKMKSSKAKKRSGSKKKTRPKKSKTSSSAAGHKRITKLVSLLAKAIKK